MAVAILSFVEFAAVGSSKRSRETGGTSDYRALLFSLTQRLSRMKLG